MPLALVRPELLYAWKGQSLVVTDLHGACGHGQPLTGYYYREARFLRTIRLECNGRQPWLCEAASPGPDSLAFTYVHPEAAQPGGGGTGQSGDEEVSGADGLPERGLEIQVTYRVGLAGLDISLAVTNRSLQRIAFECAWTIDADFADIQEALSGKREQEAPIDAREGGTGVVFRYGHATLPFRTDLHHDGGWTWQHGRLTRRIDLLPKQGSEFTIAVQPVTGTDDLSPSDVSAREAALANWRGRFARIETPGNRLFEAALASNIRDFASFPLLAGQADEWLALQAGMPLYPALFGRDAITAGWQAGLIDRGDSLGAAFARLGRLQTDRVDDWRDEEPGRIPYQVRTGPLARLDLNPYAAYYADFASPLMFVISLANLYAWTGDAAAVRRHWDTARRILDWAREFGDMDGDGYLEYRTRSSKGTKNQGWKDSGDAIVYDDGRPVPPPIATCDLQGYWFAAQELMALLCLLFGQSADAAAYRAGAAELKERFNRDWWVDEEQFFALALDSHKAQVRAVSSNVGHCLACGIIDRSRMPAVVGRLFAPDLFSGWGVRTLSTEHCRYDPQSYHRGSVWAVEQATIVFGLVRFGFTARALDLASAVFELSQLYPEFRIPECVGGFARGERPTPGAYPRANTPQLWNATAFPLIVQSMLGLLPLAPVSTLLIDPVLPSWLPELVLRDVRVGDASASLRVWRDTQGKCDWEVLHTRGTLHIVRQPPPESLTATAIDRVTDAFEALTR